MLLRADHANVPIQAAKAAEATDSGYLPADAVQAAISAKARVIAEKSATIGTARWYCENARIHFLPQPRGVAQLVAHRSPKPGVAGSSPVAPVPAVPALGGSRLKVLVVDDQWPMRLLVKVNLESEVVQVLEAENGTEAVELAVHELPDVILLDVMMPGMDGFEV